MVKTPTFVTLNRIEQLLARALREVKKEEPDLVPDLKFALDNVEHVNHVWQRRGHDE